MNVAPHSAAIRGKSEVKFDVYSHDFPRLTRPATQFALRSIWLIEMSAAVAIGQTSWV